MSGSSILAGIASRCGVSKDCCKVLPDSFLDRKVVSFDIFDTLITRQCLSPQDVFSIVESRYNELRPSNKIQSFRQARIFAEALARKATSEEEVTIEEIYQHLGKPFFDMADELLQLEIDTEITLCMPIASATVLFNRLKRLGKKIVLISDMYLPGDVIKKMLEKCGYAGFEHLYVSSETRTTKRTGSLYRGVVKELGIGFDDIVHIGDNVISDYICPKREGIRAILLKPSFERTDLFRSWKGSGVGRIDGDALEMSVLEKTVVQQLYGCTDICERTGVAVLGPMLYGYTTWLHDIICDEDVDQIWFLSREGYILKQAYDIIYGRNAQSARYVNVSRTALCRAGLSTVHSYDEMMQLISCLSNSIDTVDELLTVIGIDIDDRCLKQIRISKTACLYDVDKEKLFELIMRFGRKYFAEQHSLAIDYLSKGDEKKRIVICDIGWAGTMQAIMTKLLPGFQFIGAYLAVSSFHDSEKDVLDRTELDRRGFWCNESDWDTLGQPIRFTQSATELLFLNSEGTTLYYKYDDAANVVPIKKDCPDNDRTKLAACKLDDGARKFLEVCAECKTAEFIGRVDSGSTMLPYFNTVVRPSTEALEFYKEFSFIDGAREISIVPTGNLIYYLTHINKALEELKRNNSKVIWLRGVFRVPFPYYNILYLLSNGLGLESAYSRSVKGASK